MMSGLTKDLQILLKDDWFKSQTEGMSKYMIIQAHKQFRKSYAGIDTIKNKQGLVSFIKSFQSSFGRFSQRK